MLPVIKQESDVEVRMERHRAEGFKFFAESGITYPAVMHMAVQVDVSVMRAVPRQHIRSTVPVFKFLRFKVTILYGYTIIW